MPEVTFLLGHLDLFIGEGRACGGIPVDHPLAAIDQPLVVEIDKHLLDALGISGVHGEALAGPIAGAA
ncbi:hypothetical protein SDC9_189717 [bioreactor metagenome]|uniref:Uncharacterized protein n=1 Tax=bioreactor metagenome TaxID=1076179 RepID=A0A645HSZ2_9ZZZZ